MSIDLSKAKAISDQYGAWKQLADASGRVLWSAVPPLVYSERYSFGTITTTQNSVGHFYAVPNALPDISGFTHIMVNGELFEVSYSYGKDENGYNCHYLNIGGANTLDEAHPYQIRLIDSAGFTVLQFYSYTSGTFTVSMGLMIGGEIEGVPITITGGSYGTDAEASVTIAGVKYTNETITYVPIGTIINCYVRDDYYSEDSTDSYSYIKLNGTIVVGKTKEKSYSYNYTVTGATYIKLGYVSNMSYNKGKTLYSGTIEITG